MDDDFGTPQAVSLLFDLVRDGNRLLDEGEDAAAVAGAVETIVGVLGLDDASAPERADLDLTDLSQRFGVEADGEDMIRGLIELRNQARHDRRYADADAIREGLEQAGVILEDGADGTRWIRK
jgi:cysteinyl-tRNA synthetase